MKPQSKKILIAQLGELLFLQKTLRFIANHYPEASCFIFPNPSQKVEVGTWLGQPAMNVKNGKKISIISDSKDLQNQDIDTIVFMYHPFNYYRLRLLKHYFALKSLQAERYLVTNEGYWYRLSLMKQLGIFVFLGLSKVLVSPLLQILVLMGTRVFSLVKKMLAFDEYMEIKNWAEEGWGDSRDECPVMIIDASEMILKGYTEGRTDLLQARVCNLCGEDKPEFLFKSEDGFDYVRCQNCGYAYINSIVTQSGWDYVERQSPGWQQSAELTYLKYARSPEGQLEDEKRFNQYLNFLYKYADATERILDIGCASGNFLKLAKSQGWQPLGIEKSPLYATATARDYKLPVINATIEDVYHEVLEEYGQFDVITMWETLEHLDNPSDILDIVSKLLVDQGLVGISVPNMESLYVKILRERFPSCVGIGHINMFTAHTLTNMLRQKGFEVLYIHTLEPGWDELLALFNLDFRQAKSISGYVTHSIETDMSLREPFVNQISRLMVQTYSRFLTKLTAPINPGSVLFCIARKRKPS